MSNKLDQDFVDDWAKKLQDEYCKIYSDKSDAAFSTARAIQSRLWLVMTHIKHADPGMYKIIKETYDWEIEKTR